MASSTTIHHWLNSVIIVLMLVSKMAQSHAFHHNGLFAWDILAATDNADGSDHVAQGIQAATVDDGELVAQGIQAATVNADDGDLVDQDIQAATDNADGSDHVAQDIQAATVNADGDGGLIPQAATDTIDDGNGFAQKIQAAAVSVKNWIIVFPNYLVLVAAGVLLLIVAIAMTIVCCVCCRRRSHRKHGKEDLESGLKSKEMQKIESQANKVSKGKHRGKKQEKEETESAAEPEAESVLEPAEEMEDQDEYSRGVRHFLHKHPQYTARGALRPLDLGSRMQKYWYKIESTGDKSQEKLLTIAPVSQNCPLIIHKRQKGLNKLIEAVRVHPYLHPIEVVDYLVDHQLLVMVQPLVHSGSLKDMIYKTMPLTDWSHKYARRSKGLANDKIAKYGRHILEAMKFLYDKGFPHLQLGHVQSGNIFVVDDVCLLGGYENTLLGYRTRLFRLCKDHLQHFDVILFGHTVFEMAAGYELTHLRPSQADYKAIDKKIRPVLEFIFEQGFPHDISEISSHDFFGASLTELSDFDSEEVKISDSAVEVLDDVRKAKPRVQKAPKPLKPSTPGGSSTKESKGIISSIKSRTKSWRWPWSSKKSKSKEDDEDVELSLLQGKED